MTTQSICRADYYYDGGWGSFWDDLLVPGLSIRTQGTSDPALNVFIGNVRQYEFLAGFNNEGFFSIQLPHRWKQGTNLKPHVHWALNAAADAEGETVIWKLEYEWQDIGDTYSGTNTITATETLADAQPGKVHLLTSFDSDISGDGHTLSSVIVCRLYRLSNGAGADTYDSGAFLISADFHYEIDSFGSQDVLTKA